MRPPSFSQSTELWLQKPLSKNVGRKKRRSIWLLPAIAQLFCEWTNMLTYLSLVLFSTWNHLALLSHSHSDRSTAETNPLFILKKLQIAALIKRCCPLFVWQHFEEDLKMSVGIKEVTHSMSELAQLYICSTVTDLCQQTLLRRSSHKEGRGACLILF